MVGLQIECDLIYLQILPDQVTKLQALPLRPGTVGAEVAVSNGIRSVGPYQSDQT